MYKIVLKIKIKDSIIFFVFSLHFSLFTRTIYTNNSHFHLGDAPGSVPQPKITFPPCTPDCDNKCVDMCPDYCCVKGMIRKETGQIAEIVHSSQVIIGIKVVVKRISQKRGQGKVFLCDTALSHFVCLDATNA